jgi:hypothetical protein
MALPTSDTEIIGYAEPWIVSPGEQVAIKAGFSQISLYITVTDDN